MVSKIIYYAVIAFLTMFCVGCEKVSDENVLVSCLVNGVQYETKVPYYLGMTGLDFEQYDESCVFMLFRWLYCDDEAFCLALRADVADSCEPELNKKYMLSESQHVVSWIREGQRYDECDFVDGWILFTDISPSASNTTICVTGMFECTFTVEDSGEVIMLTKGKFGPLDCDNYMRFDTFAE